MRPEPTSSGSSPARTSCRLLGDETELLTAALALAPDTLLVERRLPGGALERARLTVDQGIPLSGRVPLSLAPVLGALDGLRPLAESSVPPPRGVSRRLSRRLPARELVARGLLVPGR